MALFTAIYGYVKLIGSNGFNLSNKGSKIYGFFDVVVTLGLFYYLFYIAYFERYSTVESAFLISVCMLIIVGKAIYYYKKGYSAEMVKS